VDTTITEVTTSVTEMVTTTVTLKETSVDAEAVNTFVYLATGFLIFYFVWSCCKWIYRFLNLFF